jgi:hypothetical protein
VETSKARAKNVATAREKRANMRMVQPYYRAEPGYK